MPKTKTRNHFVFLDPCGCPLGLTEDRPRVRTEDQAWRDMFETRGEERQAAARGVRVEHVDHDTYTRRFYPLMTRPCPHAEAVSGG